MRKTLLIVSTALVAAWLALPGVAHAQENPRTITVTGEAVVRVVPDEVLLSVGVETRDRSLAEAKRQNDVRAQAVLALAAKYEIKPEHVQTDFIRVEPLYDNDPVPMTLVGYTVQKMILFTLRDISKFESLLTDVLEDGANNVYGIEFRTTELRKYRDQARDLAVRAAKEKAEALAGALGQQVGAPLSIREDYNWWGSYYGRWGMFRGGLSQNVIQQAGPDGSGLEGSFAPGQITVSASVSVTFALK